MADKTASRSAPEFRRYCAYGVAIRSELPLPLTEMRGPTEPALFELEICGSDEPLSGAIPEGVKLQRNPLSGFDFGQFPDGSSYVRWDDVGEVLISKNGRSIACRPFRQTASESFHVYLLGQALSFALVKSGFEPLHATAVEVEDRAQGQVEEDEGDGEDQADEAFGEDVEGATGGEGPAEEWVWGGVLMLGGERPHLSDDETVAKMGHPILLGIVILWLVRLLG